jgi:acetolactate decarboxylase
MKKIFICLALITISITVSSFSSFAHTHQAGTDHYQCPMKCEGEKTYDQPGKCPVCGMALKKSSPAEVYKCPMKCEGEKTYPVAGKCPVCGMSLKKTTQPELYTCPMKCEGEKTYPAAGECSICGMSLKKINPPEVYKCPMKCEGEKTHDQPGKCSVCGMALKKISQLPGSHKKNLIKNPVKIAGAMMNVLRKGELAGTINLDTISNKEHLYGIGPVEYLKGELMILDGRSFQSTVAANGAVTVKETFATKAPFFVYANVDKWNELALPDSVRTIPQLESFLDQSTKSHSRPFAFRLTATFEKAELHVMNLPPGTAVHSPEDARKNQLTVKLKKQAAELLGFFSTEHQAVFTHHDSFVHIHILTADKKQMGHLETMEIRKGTAKLFISGE